MPIVAFGLAWITSHESISTASEAVFTFLPPYLCGFMALIPASRLHDLIASVDEAAMAAKQLGSYQLIEPLGKGGMGEVWRAEHALLRRPAAVKLIRGDLEGSARAREVNRERFEREAKATSMLQCPHTITLFDYGVAECEAYHDGIAQDVVPVLGEMNRWRQGKLGLDSLRPWDFEVNPFSSQPIRPFSSEAELCDLSRKIFQRVEPVFAELGCRLLFDAVALQPGKPLVVARHSGGWIVGLPGNPASVMVCFWLFARPLLRRLQGIDDGFWRDPLGGRLVAPLPGSGPRTRFLAAEVEIEDGEALVRSAPPKGSHDMAAYARGQ